MSTINLHLGDCMKALEGMEDNQFNLAIVDPPYGIGKNLIHKANTNKNSLIKFYKEIHHKKWDYNIPNDEFFKLLIKVSKNQIIWGGNYYMLPPSRGLICWDKMTYITSMSQVEYAWVSEDRLPQLVKINNNNPNRIHPTQKPVALYKWLLHNYAKEGDTILDTHGGSMSIAMACGEMGFNLDLWELDEEYFYNGVERVQNHFKQLDAFTEKPIINVIT